MDTYTSTVDAAIQDGVNFIENTVDVRRGSVWHFGHLTAWGTLDNNTEGSAYLGCIIMLFANCHSQDSAAVDIMKFPVSRPKILLLIIAAHGRIA